MSRGRERAKQQKCANCHDGTSTVVIGFEAMVWLVTLLGAAFTTADSAEKILP